MKEIITFVMDTKHCFLSPIKALSKNKNKRLEPRKSINNSIQNLFERVEKLGTGYFHNNKKVREGFKNEKCQIYGIYAILSYSNL